MNDDFLQIYFIFARFCEFQKLFKKIKAKELLKERSKGTDVNEGRFALNIDVLSEFQCMGEISWFNQNSHMSTFQARTRPKACCRVRLVPL